MSNLTSQDLSQIQHVIKKSIKATLDRPDCDFDKAVELVKLMEKVDNTRRKTWHDEKFGVYEEIADQFFCS